MTKCLFPCGPLQGGKDSTSLKPKLAILLLFPPSSPPSSYKRILNIPFAICGWGLQLWNLKFILEFMMQIISLLNWFHTIGILDLSITNCDWTLVLNIIPRRTLEVNMDKILISFLVVKILCIHCV